MSGEVYLLGYGLPQWYGTAMSMQPTCQTGPVRLGDLIDAGKLLWCYCCACGHEVDMDPAQLPLARETPVPEVRYRMRCSQCGAKKADTRPELYPGGIVATREKRR